MRPPAWAAVGVLLAAAAGVALLAAPPRAAVAAHAGVARTDPACGRVVIFVLPGVTWAMVQAARPPALLELVGRGAMGSLSMTTNEGSRALGAAYVTIGAGSRADEPPRGMVSQPAGPELLERSVSVAAPADLEELAAASGHSTRPGALAGLLDPVGVVGHGAPAGAPGFPGAVLAALDPRGRVDFAATGAELVRPAPSAPGRVVTDPATFHRALQTALAQPCATTIVEHGDPTRADALGDDQDKARALAVADRVLGQLAAGVDLDRDLVLVLSPTSPSRANDDHLGIAVAAGRDFARGTELTSASTRRAGIVTLEDVAPTVLAARGLDAPSFMTGRAWRDVPSKAPAARVARAVELDAESVFAVGAQPRIVTAYVAVQALVYLLAAGTVLRARRLGGIATRALEFSALAIVSFPLASYLVGPLAAHELGAVGLALAIAVVDAALVGLLAAVPVSSLERLFWVCLATVGLLGADIMTGGDLQPNALFGNYPVVGGRFAGLGNTAFAILGAASLLCGALIAELWGARPWARPAVAFLFVVTIIVDGTPALGSDVGGVLALVPVLGLSFVLLWGRRPTPRTVAAVAGAGALILVLFTAVDLARPPVERTHLGRLAEAVADRGPEPLVDAIGRKIAANLGIFRLSLWSLFAPLVVAVAAVLVTRWHALARLYPRLRIGLLMMVVLAALGSALNDSGVVIGALVIPFLLSAIQLVAPRVRAGSA